MEFVISTGTINITQRQHKYLCHQLSITAYGKTWKFGISTVCQTVSISACYFITKISSEQWFGGTYYTNSQEASQEGIWGQQRSLFSNSGVTKYSNSWSWPFTNAVAHGRRTRSIISFKNTLLNPMAYDPSEVQWLLEEKTTSSEEVFWSELQVAWTIKTWRYYHSATGKNLGIRSAVWEI